MTGTGPKVADAVSDGAVDSHHPGSSTPHPRPSSRSSRTRRRSFQRVHHRRRLVALLAIVGLAVAGVATGIGTDLVRDGFRRLVPEGSAPSVVSQPESLLLAWPTASEGAEGTGGTEEVGGDGAARVDEVAGAAGVLFGVEPEVENAGALLMPGFAQFEVPSLGLQTFADTVSAGASPLGLAVENMLGVDVGRTVVFDADDLAPLFEPFAPFEVRLRSPVRFDEHAFRSGRQPVSAADAVRLMTVRADGANDLDHLVVVHAVLEGWTARLDGDAAAVAAERLGAVGRLSDGVVNEVTAVLAEMGRRRVVFDTLDVEPLGLPDGERYAVALAAEAEAASVFPGLVYRPGERVHVEIRNGVGRAGLATEVARRVIPAGARVVLSGNAAEFGLEETFVVVRDESFAGEAERLIEALGVGDLRRSDDMVGTADIVIIVGEDFEPGGA